MYYSDIEDAYQVVLVMSGIEDNDEELLFRKQWENALKRAKNTTFDFNEIEKVKRCDHGRSVHSKYLENKIILGQTKAGHLVALDGSHRIKEHLKRQSPHIEAVVVDISWVDDADDMDWDYP